MFGCGGGTRIIQAQQEEAAPSAEAPKKSDKAVQDAAAEALRRRRNQRGYRSTIFANFMNDDQRRQLAQTLGS